MEMRDEKLHAVVARSTFRSQNAQNTSKHTILGPLLEVEMSKKCTPLWREHISKSKSTKNTRVSDHFWKLRCRKSARRCGAKHVSKSKCTKHTILGPLLEVEMSKKCTPLWREHISKSKSTKNTRVSDHFWKLRCRKSARRCGAKHVSKSKCTKHTILGPLLEVEMLKKCTPLWREHISKSKCTKHTMYGPFLEVQMSKKCTPVWREAHFQVKMHKAHHVRTIFGGSDVVSRCRRKVLWTLSKVSKT